MYPGSRPTPKHPGQVVDGFFGYPRKRRKRSRNGMVALDVSLDGGPKANLVKLVVVLARLLKLLGIPSRTIVSSLLLNVGDSPSLPLRA